MPSLEESRRQVREHVHDDIDHDSILASLQDEIDRHNAIKGDLNGTIRKDKIRKTRHGHEEDKPSERPMKFRFKSQAKEDEGTKDKRKQRSSHHESRRKRRKHAAESEPTPHPFPREPVDPIAPDQADPTTAFRASLFDALADDEGAAAYWENVYSQPIHVYSRPSTQNRQTGKLEQMTDEEYVEYVKTQMWERKNPEVVFERERKERERRKEEERRTREREDFVRRKERRAWERSQKSHFRRDDDSEENEEDEGRHEHEFAGEKDFATQHSARTRQREEYSAAWSAYQTAWDTLKRSLVASEESKDTDTNPSKQIPWPTLPGIPATKPNIEAFFTHTPSAGSQERLRMLKAERVRWHPDKMQQRFRGKVDEGTMKLVTGVFQIVDSILESERKKVD